jgi:hypothetical protein
VQTLADPIERVQLVDEFQIRSVQIHKKKRQTIARAGRQTLSVLWRVPRSRTSLRLGKLAAPRAPGIFVGRPSLSGISPSETHLPWRLGSLAVFPRIASRFDRSSRSLARSDRFKCKAKKKEKKSGQIRSVRAVCTSGALPGGDRPLTPRRVRGLAHLASGCFLGCAWRNRCGREGVLDLRQSLWSGAGRSPSFYSFCQFRSLVLNAISTDATHYQ